MKFWQLLSIFRDESSILADELKKPEWSSYQDLYNRLDVLIKNQHRDILDMQVDPILVNDISLKSNKVIFYVDTPPRIFMYRRPDTLKIIPISKAIDLFNHDEIEEVFEKSEANVRRLSDSEFT